MSEEDSTSRVTCTLTPEQTAVRAERIEGELTDRYERTEERVDGYTLTFDGAHEALPAVTAFVADELACCSFAEYEITVSPPYEETHLTITGPEGTKELFREGLVGLLEVANGE